MKIQVISGVGGLLLVIPGALMGVSYVDSNAWPPLTDIRWILVILGVVMLVVGRILYEREVDDA